LRCWIGACGWKVLVYVFIEGEDRVVVVTIQDGRSSDAARSHR